jgi:Carboxypeptidase regulatory-like domain
MQINRTLRRTADSLITAVLVATLIQAGAPVLMAQEGVAGQGPLTASLEGRVFGPDRVTPVPGAVVRAIRGDGAQVYSSMPADEKGNYSISNLKPGSYDIVVEVSDGVFVVERTLSISEAKAYSLSLATVPAENVTKEVSAVDKPVKGYAWTLEGKGPKAGGFWRTPGGIAIIAGGAVGLAALLLNGGNDHNNKGSNSTP